MATTEEVIMALATENERLRQAIISSTPFVSILNIGTLKYLSNLLENIETCKQQGDVSGLLQQYKDLTEDASRLNGAVKTVIRTMKGGY